MRRVLAVALLWCFVAPAWGQRPLRHVLFDFDGGVEGWWGNVWGGAGTAKPSMTGESVFGSGALHCEVSGVEGGSNTVSPWLPKDAEWRQYPWGSVSLWVRGDGSREAVQFTVATGFEGEEEQIYAYSIPLDSTEWRRIDAPIGSFWNRYSIPMDVARIGRVMFGGRGTHHFDIDHIALEERQRPVPLEPADPPEGIDLHPSLSQLEDGRYVLRFLPGLLLPGGATIEATMRLPGRDMPVRQDLPGGPPRDEVLLVWPDPKEDAAAMVSLQATREGGARISSARYSCRLLTPRPSPDPTPLSLVPAPKELRLGDGASFPLDARTPIHVLTGKADGQHAVNLLTDTLRDWLGSDPVVRTARGAAGSSSAIVLGADAPRLSQQLSRRAAALPAEGYVLRATGRGVRTAANDARGLVNGVCTLLQAAESHYAQTFELAVPPMEVIDWPSLPIRAVSLALPTNRWGYPNDAPVDPAFFTEFLRRIIVRQKLNMAVLIVEQAMQYRSHPNVAGPAAWSPETVKSIFDALRRYGVEPVPLCNSLGHADWLAIPYPQLAEDGDVHQLCTSNPETKRILLDLYQEIVDMVKPKYFHIGMDEVRWQTDSLPEEKRCKLCAGKDKRDIFAEWVQMLHEFFARQGIEVMMWGDMVLPEHNGRVPYAIADTIDRLPKDIVMCNWSTELAPASSHWFRQHGFERVIKANSQGATRQEQDWLVGNMMGIWSKIPWLAEGTSPNLAGYTYLSILESAEHSWNAWPDLFDPIVPLSNEFFERRPLAQWRVAAVPVPGAKAPEPVPLSEGAPTGGIPTGEVKIGGITFAASGSALAPEPGHSATVPIGRRVAALYLLHAAELPDREAMVEALKPSKAWEGVHIGSYEIAYASGETVSIPVRYPLELRTPQSGWCTVPLAYRALGVYPSTCEAEGTHLYAIQWVNPHPEEPVASITVKALAAPARLMLTAVDVQSPSR
jgi:hypothetical protein